MTGKSGFIVLRISDSGIEGTKIYHTRKATARILSLYERITPDLGRLDEKIRSQGDGAKIEGRGQSPCSSTASYFKGKRNGQ